MDFEYSDEQKMLKDSARKFLEEEAGVDHLRAMLDDKQGFSRDTYKKMAELGWMGLMIPEQYGGLEQSLVDLMVIQEEIGRTLTPEPFFSTVVLGALPVMYGGSEHQKEEILPKVAAGEVLMTMALFEPKVSYDPADIEMKAQAEGKGFILNGAKMFVPDAHAADKIVVAARTRDNPHNPTDGITLFLVDADAPGVNATDLRSIDHRRRAKVEFTNVAVTEDDVIGAVDNGWDVLNRVVNEATAALCAEMVGGAEKVLEMTVEYTKTREAFGVPIGSLQAVQHKAADMLIAKECAKSATMYAVMACAENRDDAEYAVSAAKAWASDAYMQCTAAGIQLHGGIGFTWEHDIHFYYKRAKATEVTFGDAQYHRDKAAGLLDF